MVGGCKSGRLTCQRGPGHTKDPQYLLEGPRPYQRSPVLTRGAQDIPKVPSTYQRGPGHTKGPQYLLEGPRPYQRSPVLTRGAQAIPKVPSTY